MDYDDIDYDEGYSMIDIDNNQSNSNMEYDETDSDSVNSGSFQCLPFLNYMTPQ